MAFDERLNLGFERTHGLSFNQFPFVIRAFPETRYALILRSHLGEYFFHLVLFLYAGQIGRNFFSLG
jgi:hypothetical protein